MEDPTKDIDALMLPNRWIFVAQALERIEGYLQKMREAGVLCRRLLVRLQFLRRALKKPSSSTADPSDHEKLVTRFALTISDVLRFFRKFAKKRAIQRIAASRLVREGVQRLHSSIDIIFQDAGLSNAPEMTEWKEHEAAGIQEQLERLREIVTTSGAIVRDLSPADVEEALLEIRLELERRNNPPEFVELLKSASDHRDVTALGGVIRWELEPWFIRRDTVDLAETPFDMGSFGDVYKAKRGAEGADVCVKLLLVDSPDAQAQFLREARIWHKLNHPNVIKMLGGCHVGRPLFFISELAKAGNFVKYLGKSENKDKLWQLFLEAAQGLSYLHSEQIIHADIKCNNLLVGDDGLAKLYGFGSKESYTVPSIYTLRSEFRGLNVRVRWDAPERILEQGPAANPTSESDVFSLGMSIIEAKTGERPWGLTDGDEIIEALFDGEDYPRPDGVFTDREWELVQGMTEFDPNERWPLNQAIEVLKGLADEAAAAANAGSRYFRVDRTNTAHGEKFIQRIIDRNPGSSWSRQQVSGELSRLVEEEATALAEAAVEGDSSEPPSTADIEDSLKLIADHFQHHVPRLNQDDCNKFLRQIQQVADWCILETKMQKQWEANFPEFTLCNSCNSHNPVDNFDCCECGEELLRIRRDNLDFRFTVSDMSSLGEAISTFEQMQDAVIEELVMHRLPSVQCPVCAKNNPVGQRLCGACGSRLDTTDQKRGVTSGLSVRLALQLEVQRLKSILDCSRQEEAARERAWRVPPKEEACNRCGEMNLESEMFCRECGLDIEFRREIRL